MWYSRCRVGRWEFSDDYPWHILQALEQLAEKLLRRVLITAALHENVEHVIVLIDGPPQVMPFTIDC
jgi:hypothetical protein